MSIEVNAATRHVQAGMVTAALLQAKDEAGYAEVEKSGGPAAGHRVLTYQVLLINVYAPGPLWTLEVAGLFCG